MYCNDILICTYNQFLSIDFDMYTVQLHILNFICVLIRFIQFERILFFRKLTLFNGVFHFCIIFVLQNDRVELWLSAAEEPFSTDGSSEIYVITHNLYSFCNLGFFYFSYARESPYTCSARGKCTHLSPLHRSGTIHIIIFLTAVHTAAVIERRHYILRSDIYSRKIKHVKSSFYQFIFTEPGITLRRCHGRERSPFLGQ